MIETLERSRKSGPAIHPIAARSTVPLVADLGKRKRAPVPPLVLMLASVCLLSLAAAPVGQWYLAWIALAPWFVAVGRATTMRGVLVRSWVSGVAYFGVTLWWLWAATLSGAILLIFWFALFWALAAGLMYGLRLLAPIPHDSGEHMSFQVISIAMVWVAVEWLRCNIVLEFPWLPMGSTQAPIVLMCQVADLGGPWLVSFWLVLPSALAALVWLNRNNRASWRGAGLTVASLLAVTAFYGAWRLYSAPTMPGPRVMVVQSNFPHSAGGAPTVDREQSVAYFLEAMPRLLAAHDADLVVLPEAEFPAMNEEARRELPNSPARSFLEYAHLQLLSIARDTDTALVVGGSAITNWVSRDKHRVGLEKRNCAYFFNPQAPEAVVRYDKIHLVRFAERAMLPTGPEWLRRLALAISAGRAVQPLKAGSLSEFHPFQLGSQNDDAPATLSGNKAPNTSFIAPICLENIDPAIAAQMIRDPGSGGKRADFIANLSNDGWFATQERYQHLQTTILRCIENRVPMVRCSNTGISAFIDSSGRVLETIPSNEEGFAVRQIDLDPRVTFYTRYGDVFAFGCMGFVVAAVVGRGARRFTRA